MNPCWIKVLLSFKNPTDPKHLNCSEFNYYCMLYIPAASFHFIMKYTEALLLRNVLGQANLPFKQVKHLFFSL